MMVQIMEWHLLSNRINPTQQARTSPWSLFPPYFCFSQERVGLEVGGGWNTDFLSLSLLPLLSLAFFPQPHVEGLCTTPPSAMSSLQVTLAMPTGVSSVCGRSKLPRARSYTFTLRGCCCMRRTGKPPRVPAHSLRDRQLWSLPFPGEEARACRGMGLALRSTRKAQQDKERRKRKSRTPSLTPQVILPPRSFSWKSLFAVEQGESVHSAPALYLITY